MTELLPTCEGWVITMNVGLTAFRGIADVRRQCCWRLSAMGMSILAEAGNMLCTPYIPTDSHLCLRSFPYAKSSSSTVFKTLHRNCLVISRLSQSWRVGWCHKNGSTRICVGKQSWRTDNIYGWRARHSEEGSWLLPTRILVEPDKQTVFLMLIFAI